MAGITNHYGLQKLGAGDPFSTNGYKFVDRDRDMLDRLAYLGAEGHRHTGEAAEVAAPTMTLALAIDGDGGSIPAGTRVHYKYTLVDVNGFETAPSSEVFIDTPAAITEPAAPVLTQATTGGLLLPGSYYYVLTAYSPVNTSETKAAAPAYITVPVGTSTNRITITFPTPPAGAVGWNIYRKKPGDARYNYLASVSVATPSVTDTGAVAEDCNRTVPTRNTTNATNAVEIILMTDDATPVMATVPPGFTWKLYRTYIAGSYLNSTLHWVVEETFEGSGVIAPFYIDVGAAVTAGGPPEASQFIGSPSKIDIEDAAEVQGRLPMGAVSAFPFIATFHFAGPLAEIEGSALFSIEWPQATIVGVRCTLGLNSVPAVDDVIVDVNLYPCAAATPVLGTIFTDQGDRPRVLVGETCGERAVPAVTELVEGDCLTVDIDQVGGGATPTDRDLTVNIYMLAYGFDLTSHPWA